MKSLSHVRVFRGWWIVCTGFLGQFTAGGSAGWVFGVLILPMQAELGWSRSVIVGVLTLERLIDGVFGVWLGRYVDQKGARLAITLSALAGGACLIGIAMVQAPWQSYALWACFGLVMPGLATIGPIASIANWFVRKRAQAIMAFTFGSASAGLILAPLMAGVADAASWRLAWVIMGLLVASIAPLAWLSVRQRPEDVGLEPDGGVGPAPSAVEVRSQAALVAAESYWTVSLALRSRTFWLLTFGFMLVMLPASSIFIHMSAFVQSRGFSVEAGAGAVSIYGFGALLGRFVWGFVVAKAGLRRALITWSLLYGLSIFLYVVPHSLPAIYATSVLLGISISGSQQLRAQAYPDYFGRKIVGSLLGYAGIIGTVTGASAPLIVAIAFDHTGTYVPTFAVFGVCCLVASVAFLLSAPRVFGRAENVEAAGMTGQS